MNGALRRQARDRAHGRCEYGRLPDWLPPLESFHLEPITARQHGGATDADNLAWACHRCNRHKGTNLVGIDPETRELAPLFHPRLDQWTAHFALVGIRIAGLTPTGRATASLLQMNASRRAERRAELVKRGWY